MHYLKVAAVILIVGIVLFGIPFANGAADLLSLVASGLYEFFTELRGPSGSAVG